MGLRGPVRSRWVDVADVDVVAIGDELARKTRLLSRPRPLNVGGAGLVRELPRIVWPGWRTATLASLVITSPKITSWSHSWISLWMAKRNNKPTIACTRRAQQQRRRRRRQQLHCSRSTTTKRTVHSKLQLAGCATSAAAARCTQSDSSTSTNEQGKQQQQQQHQHNSEQLQQSARCSQAHRQRHTSATRQRIRETSARS